MRRRGAAREAALVALVVGIGGGLFYWPARRCSVISDGWHLLHIGSQPLREAILTRLDYHFSPIAHLLNGLLWRAFGMRDGLYQAENLLSLGLLAAALYALARRLFGDRVVAFTALVLFLANASYFEVPLWPVVGNFQSLAAILYVAAVACALRSGAASLAGGAPATWGWAAAFGLFALLAFFTYEPTFSVVAVGVLAAALAGTPSPPGAAAGGWRRALPAATAALGVVAVAVAVKLALAAAGDNALFLPRDLETVRLRALFLLRAIGGLFLLRSAETLPSRALVGVARLNLGEPWFDAVAAGLLLAVAAAGALLLWKGGPAIRLVTSWLAIHYLLLVVATTPESRHNLIPALPAAMLAAALLHWVGRSLARRSGAPLVRRHAPLLVPAVAVLALLPGARRDLALAADLYAEGTAATRRLRTLVEERVRQAPPLAAVALVNLPAKVHEHGIGAYWFINGAHLLVEMASGGEVPHRRVKFFRTFEPIDGGEFANGSRTISRRKLRRRAADPATLVLVFDPERRTLVRMRPAPQRPRRAALEAARRGAAEGEPR